MRILGIDLGSSSIKAVEMDSAFGRYEIHDYHEVLIPAEATSESAMKELLRSLKKLPDRMIVALPAGQTTFRNFQMPTRDRRAIQSGIGFELEDELPFSSDESLFDYSITDQNKQSSTVHVAATLKHHLKTTIEAWKKGSIEPDVITTEAWAYRILLNRLLGPTEQQSPVLLVQIGNEKTTFYLHWKGAPAVVREMTWGGRDLTLGICQKYRLPYQQAETAKLDHGFISLNDTSENQTEDQNEFSSCLKASLETFLLELRQVSLISKSTTQQNIQFIYLAGGTALLPGLGAWIEERLRIPTKPIHGLSSTTTSGVTYSEETEARLLLAASLTFSLVGPDRAFCINFRKGEFAKQGKSRQMRLALLKRPLIALSIVSFCLFLSLIVQSSVYRSQLTTTNGQLEKSIRSFFGQISTSALKTYLSNTTTLRTSVQKELNQQKELAKLFGPHTHSPLDYLNHLSMSIPKDLVVDLIQFQTGSAPTESFIGEPTQSTTISFSVANPQVAERLSALLTAKINHIQRGKMEEIISEGGQKKWKMTFTGKPNEDSYGK